MNLIPYRFTCSICDREFRADSEEETVMRARKHLDRKHDKSIEREEIRKNIQED